MDDRERTARKASRTTDGATNRKSLRIEERLATFDDALRPDTPSGSGASSSHGPSGTGSMRKMDTGALHVQDVSSASISGASDTGAMSPSILITDNASSPADEPQRTADAIASASPAEGSQAAEKPRSSSAGASVPPQRYVRRRTPHRSQGVVDDLNDNSIPSASYTHDSNITVGGSTPLSGMTYRRARSDMSRVHGNTRYGQYLEIPKGRRSIFASRERARRRKSVLALLFVVALLVLAAYFLWNMMENVLN